MASWRDRILQEFMPGINRLMLVADPDGLMVEEALQAELEARGFKSLLYDDPVAFRFELESKYRTRWDRGEEVYLAVIVPSDHSAVDNLPYDVAQAGRKLSFGLAELFPTLNYQVVAALDRSDLDQLYQALPNTQETMGANATKDFALRHVFGIAPELIKQDSDLLVVLLRLHLPSRVMPEELAVRFVGLLRQRQEFAEWPLDDVLRSRDNFFAFLQERWPIFLEHVAHSDPDGFHESLSLYKLRFSGPALVPFGHDDVRIYIDNLFTDGILMPVQHRMSSILAKRWVGVGLKIDPDDDDRRRVAKLLNLSQESLPQLDALHAHWVVFAQRWAELLALWYQLRSGLLDPFRKQFALLQATVDEAFLSWMVSRYGALHNHPPLPPVMVHHVARSLHRSLERGEAKKVALILVDGLALDQWVTIRNSVLASGAGMRFHEGAVFAWVPTVTSISRQAVFSGKPPILFPEYVLRTDKDAEHWRRLWTAGGMAADAVRYINVLGDEQSIEQLDEVLQPNVQALGMVIRMVDQMMHGMLLGSGGMHAQILTWITNKTFQLILEKLVAAGFAVAVTSDHGNVEARGLGRINEGVVPDIRGERVRIYPDRDLVKQTRTKYPETIEWPPIGLPNGVWPLISPGRRAFVDEDERVVAHGGPLLEEVIVPYIEVQEVA